MRQYDSTFPVDKKTKATNKFTNQSKLLVTFPILPAESHPLHDGPKSVSYL